MCGIAGKLSWDEPPTRELVERMNARIAHRGPDAGGVVVRGPVALGNRRLAIIDLSPAGNQPMSDASGNFWIAYNGETYNFLSIRKELEGLGARFRTDTDTEVILEAYKTWGVSCFTRLNGMFALALWDGPARKLVLARDRLGKKPLFYRELPGGGLVFASELKALVEDPSVSREIDVRALHEYLALNYTLTSTCILKGVRKLPAGHYAVAEKDKPLTTHSYWDLASSFANKRRYRSEGEAAEALRTLVDDAVRLRLVSDVPLGVFLSGGVDSSAIVAAMCQARSPADVHSFSMGFEEKTFSELPKARAVSELLHVHHRDSVTHADAAALLPEIVYYADEPFADTSIIPMYLLAEFARKHVTVCLSGDGGDEVFGGYETYTADQLHHMTRFIPGWVSKSLHRAVDRFWPVSHDKVGFDYKLRQFLEGHALTPERAHYHWRRIFSPEEAQALLTPRFRKGLDHDEPFHEFERHRGDVSDCHYLDQAMYVDIKTWLVDDILVKVDRATMAHSLEARAPLLDYRIVEFAAALPVSLKIKNLKKKYLFKLSQRGRLPGWVLAQKKKGFNAPINHWMATPGAGRFRELTLRPIAGEVVFDPSAVERLWTEHARRKKDNSLKLLGLVSFCLWCEQYGARW